MRLLAGQGYAVVVADVDAAAAGQLAAEIDGAAVTLDVADLAETTTWLLRCWTDMTGLTCSYSTPG